MDWLTHDAWETVFSIAMIVLSLVVIGGITYIVRVHREARRDRNQ